MSKYGTTAYGTSPYGGEEYTPFVLPTLAPGSDRLDATEHVVAAEVVHRRHGVIIGARVHSSRSRWHVVFRAIERDELENLLIYFKDRVFNLLPAGDANGTSIVVRWVQNEFHAPPMIGGYYDVEFDLEELPNYAA